MTNDNLKMGMLICIACAALGLATWTRRSDSPTITIRKNDFVCSREHREASEETMSTGDTTYTVPSIISVCDQWTRR